MYKLKNVVKRGSALAGAVGLLVGVGTSAMPAFVSADSLNPLTERSLSLSSSSPGWAYTDGSGNTTYAKAGTGTNGKETGNTFSFRVSSTQSINGFTFQYCTTPAGLCMAPGDDTVHGTDVPDTTSDLKIVTNSPTEVTGADYASPLTSSSTATSTGDTGADKANYGQVKEIPDGQDGANGPYQNNPMNEIQPNGIGGNFVVLTGSSATGFVNTYSGGWTMDAVNQEEVASGSKTNQVNMIRLLNTSGVSLSADDYVKVIFFATDDNYIQNPGSGAFFVKINDFLDSNTTQALSDLDPVTATQYDPATDSSTPGSYIVDGGVTVANVMNQSIQIQTKVLETMDFSVGTVDPDTLTDTELAATTLGHATHGPCDPIQTAFANGQPQNVLKLGDSDAEDSLQTAHTFATHSFWRLSSNSSGGATVYYAGNTLSNTEGDRIASIGTTPTAPTTGAEQFGLALDNGSSGPYSVNYSWAKDSAADGSGLWYEAGADSGKTGIDASFTSDTTAATDVHNPQLAPLAPINGYGGGTGGINTIPDPDAGGPLTGETIGTTFAFDPNSQTVPTAIASESSKVVDCVTGKMRYIANIAATTPAGIYTTKINYIASPQY